MKVALIDPLGQHSGNHYYTDQLARGLTHAGAQVTVYTHAGDVDQSPDRPYEYLQPYIGIYGSRHIALRGLQFLRCTLAAFAGIVRRHTDIVHVQIFSHDIREVLQVGLAKLLGRKVVITIHDIAPFGRASNDRNLDWMITHCNGVVVHNKYCLDLLTSSFRLGVPVAVIPHANQASAIGDVPDRASARRRLDLPQDKKIFLFFGNCREEKGLDVALRAVAQLKPHSDRLLFVTAGKMKPHEEATYRKLADELGLGDLLRMDVGLIPDDAAIDYYRAADAIVIPYRQVYESGVVIQASTCARAVVASDCPPLLEATENGRLGLHFPNGDSTALAATMIRAMSAGAELDAMGGQTREKVLRERDPDVVGRQTYSLYETVLTGSECDKDR